MRAETKHNVLHAVGAAVFVGEILCVTAVIVALIGGALWVVKAAIEQAIGR